MAKVYIGNSGYKLNVGNVKVKRGYIGNRLFYTGAIKVYYHIDSIGPLVYMEEVEEGSTCLSPRSFNPNGLKPGHTFYGWRADEIPSSVVFDNLIAGEEDIHLYAVYKKDITVTWYNGSNTATKSYYSAYYNNGNYLYPTCSTEESTLKTVSGYTVKIGWSPTLNTFVQSYSSGASIQFKQDTTLYSIYSQNVIVYSINGDNTKKSYSGVRYIEYANGQSYNSHPTITLSHASVYGWSSAGWSVTANNVTKACDDGTVTITANYDGKTFYALYRKDIIIYVLNPTSAGTGTRVSHTLTRINEYIGGGVIYTANPTIALSHKSISGWNNSGWNMGEAANVIRFNDGNVPVTPDMDGKTIYPIYSRTVSVITYNGKNTSATVKEVLSGTRYRRIDVDRYYEADPTVTLKHASISGWGNGGWVRSDGAATYNDGNLTINTAIENKTIYAIFTKSVTVSWYDNSNTPVKESKNIKYIATANGYNYEFPLFSRYASSYATWTAMGWSTSSTWVTTPTYNDGQIFTVSSNISLFAVYKKTIKVTTHTIYGDTTYTGIGYYNKGLSSTPSQYIPYFNIPNVNYLDGRVFKGWSEGPDSVSIRWETISNVQFANSTNIYAVAKWDDKLIYEGDKWYGCDSGYYNYNHSYDFCNLDVNKYYKVDVKLKCSISVAIDATGGYAACTFRAGVLPKTKGQPGGTGDPGYYVELRGEQYVNVNPPPTIWEHDQLPCANRKTAIVSITNFKTDSSGFSMLRVCLEGNHTDGFFNIYKIYAYGRLARS